MVGSLEQKVRSDEMSFMKEFTDRLRQLHTRYRQLEQVNLQLSSQAEFDKDIDAMIKQRDELNRQCSDLDEHIRRKQEAFIVLKKQNQEL